MTQKWAVPDFEILKQRNKSKESSLILIDIDIQMFYVGYTSGILREKFYFTLNISPLLFIYITRSMTY